MPFSKNNEHREYFVKRFGIPESVMNEYNFYEFAKGVWATRAGIIPEGKIETVGIRALRLTRVQKPTTAFLRVVGKYARKNVIILSEQEGEKFLRGAELPGKCEGMRGYVVVRRAEDILGCGLCTESKLLSQIPRKYRPEQTWI